MIHPAIESWVGANIGTEAARSLARLPWGFSTPTAMATDADGSRRVIQLFPDTAAAERSRQGALLLEGAGVRVPQVLHAADWRGNRLVVTEYVAGTPAAALISTPDSEAMARGMGSLGAVLRKRVAQPREATGMWAGPGSLETAAGGWRSHPLNAVLQHAARLVSNVPWTPTLSHGDFVPANALMGPSGVAALVDTADVGYRHPLVDAAWWCLMVRHHHPVEAARLTRTFLHAGEFEEPPSTEMLANVALLRSVELAAANPGCRRSSEPQSRGRPRGRGSDYGAGKSPKPGASTWTPGMAGPGVSIPIGPIG